MAEDADRYDGFFEAIKSGGTKDLHAACERVVLLWKDVPVQPLLALKDQLHRLDLEDREADLDESLICIAERRPAPFTAIAADPGHPHWRSAVEVLSMVGAPEYLDLFLTILPHCPRKFLNDLIRAIGRYGGARAVDAVGPYLTEGGEEVFFEVVMALKRDGGPGALAYLKEGLKSKRREGSDTSSVLEAVVMEMEGGGPG